MYILVVDLDSTLVYTSYSKFGEAEKISNRYYNLWVSTRWDAKQMLEMARRYFKYTVVFSNSEETYIKSVLDATGLSPYITAYYGRSSNTLSGRGYAGYLKLLTPTVCLDFNCKPESCYIIDDIPEFYDRDEIDDRIAVVKPYYGQPEKKKYLIIALQKLIKKLSSR